MVCIDGFRLKSKDWYQHLKTKDLDQHIQTAVSDFGNQTRGIYLGMDIGSPDHGQQIDSQLSEDGYSVYWLAEIFSQASFIISINECPLYILY